MTLDDFRKRVVMVDDIEDEPDPATQSNVRRLIEARLSDPRLGPVVVSYGPGPTWPEPATPTTPGTIWIDGVPVDADTVLGVATELRDAGALPVWSPSDAADVEGATWDEQPGRPSSSFRGRYDSAPSLASLDVQTARRAPRVDPAPFWEAATDADLPSDGVHPTEEGVPWPWDAQPDTVHPSAAGYDAVARALLKSERSLLLGVLFSRTVVADTVPGTPETAEVVASIFRLAAERSRLLGVLAARVIHRPRKPVVLSVETTTRGVWPLRGRR